MAIGNAFIGATLFVIYRILDFYVWIIIAGGILSWLVAFNIINTNNRFVYVIGDMLYRMTEPVYRRLRRFIPTIGGIDLSPLAVIFIIMFLQVFIQKLIAG